jgi:transposase
LADGVGSSQDFLSIGGEWLMRYAITDEIWAAWEPLVQQAKTHKGDQPPVLSERMFFEAVLYLARTGIQLWDLPGEFGNRKLSLPCNPS